MELWQLGNIYEHGNKACFFNKLPTKAQEAITRHLRHDNNESLFLQEERELLKELRERKRLPSPLVNSLRIRIWAEFDYAVAESRSIDITQICQGLTSDFQFLENILTDPHQCAWIVSKPMEYHNKLKEAVSFGLDKMRAALDLDVTTWDEDGNVSKVDYKLLALQFSILKHLDDRVHGQATQKSIQITATTNAKNLQRQVAELPDEDILARLREARAEEQKALHAPDHTGEILVPDEEYDSPQISKEKHQPDYVADTYAPLKTDRF